MDVLSCSELKGPKSLAVQSGRRKTYRRANCVDYGALQARLIN